MSAADTAAGLYRYKLNDVFAFNTTPRDLAQTSLASAHAIATMLGAAFYDTDETALTNKEVIRSAFDGIACLIALAAFTGDAA